MNYTATFTRNENGDYRVVLVDETSNPKEHTALECADLRGLLFELSKTIEDREADLAKHACTIEVPCEHPIRQEPSNDLSFLD